VVARREREPKRKADADLIGGKTPCPFLSCDLLDGWHPFPFSFASHSRFLGQRFLGPFSFIFQEVWGRGGCLIYKRCNFFSTSTYQFGSSICSLCASSTDSSPFSPILNICAAGGLDWIGQRKQTTGGRAAGEGKAKATEPTAWLHAPPWFAGIAVADWTIGADSS